MKLLAVLLLSCLPAVARTQMLTVGETFSQVWKQNGRPLKNAGCCEIRYRRTTQNEFEIRTAYGEDFSASRLHPVLRVSDIEFRPDRAKNWRTTAKEIAEVRFLCRSGCVAAAKAMDRQNTDKFDLKTVEIYVCPKRGDEAGSWWKDRDTQEVCITARFDMDADVPAIGKAEIEVLPVTDLGIFNLKPAEALQAFSFSTVWALPDLTFER